jgi:hypothetical protein
MSPIDPGKSLSPTSVEFMEGVSVLADRFGTEHFEFKVDGSPDLSFGAELIVEIVPRRLECCSIMAIVYENTINRHTVSLDSVERLAKRFALNPSTLLSPDFPAMLTSEEGARISTIQFFDLVQVVAEGKIELTFSVRFVRWAQRVAATL